MNEQTQPHTTALHAIGQSLWLDTITRPLLDSGTLQRYIDTLSLTGLTSNPTIFDHALKDSHDYDADIRARRALGLSDEAQFFELALLAPCRASHRARSTPGPTCASRAGAAMATTRRARRPRSRACRA